VVDRLLIAGQAGPGVAELAAWQRPKLPASGRDLISRGVVPGPEVARRLGVFERAWVAAGFPEDAAQVAALLDAAAG
jgi:poly(A) polymerase